MPREDAEFLAGAAAATFDPDAITDSETNPASQGHRGRGDPDRTAARRRETGAGRRFEDDPTMIIRTTSPTSRAAVQKLQRCGGATPGRS